MTEHDYVEFWHCADCVTRCIKQSAPLTGCGKEQDGKVCGTEKSIENKAAAIGQYYVFAPTKSRESGPIPNSHHVFVNDGALMIFDNGDNIIQIYAPGHWMQVMHESQIEAREKKEREEMAKMYDFIEGIE